MNIHEVRYRRADQAGGEWRETITPDYAEGRPLHEFILGLDADAAYECVVREPGGKWGQRLTGRTPAIKDGFAAEAPTRFYAQEDGADAMVVEKIPAPKLARHDYTRFPRAHERAPVRLQDMDGKEIDAPQRIAVEFPPRGGYGGAVYDVRYAWIIASRPMEMGGPEGEGEWKTFRLGPIEDRIIGEDGLAFFHIWIDERDEWWPGGRERRQTSPDQRPVELEVEAQMRELRWNNAPEVDSDWSESLRVRLYYWGEPRE